MPTARPDQIALVYGAIHVKISTNMLEGASDMGIFKQGSGGGADTLNRAT